MAFPVPAGALEPGCGVRADEHANAGVVGDCIRLIREDVGNQEANQVVSSPAGNKDAMSILPSSSVPSEPVPILFC